MARKFPFEFDFDEDVDPVDELHRLRVASAKHFQSVDAVMDYCATLPTTKEILADLRKEIAGEKANAGIAPSKKAGTIKKSAPARRRKAAKRLTTA